MSPMATRRIRPPLRPLSPGFEAATEAFELVGRIDDGALLIWVQRF